MYDLCDFFLDWFTLQTEKQLWRLIYLLENKSVWKLEPIPSLITRQGWVYHKVNNLNSCWCVFLSKEFALFTV